MNNYKKERLKYQKGYLKHQYGDPTYLTFFLMFDWGGSPLFNGAAAAWLRDVCNEQKRADQLIEFTRLLQRLNAEMPWYFYELEGFENTYKFEELKEAYRGTDEGLKIKCIETLDLSIAGLMDMYRNIAFDIDRWCEVLPHNLTYFNMFVIVSDARNIAGKKLNTSNQQTTDFVTQDRDYTVINQDIAYTSKAHFMVGLKKCSFTSESGTSIFGGLSTTEPKLAENEIGIKYQIVKYYSKQYLNEFQGMIDSNKLYEKSTQTGDANGQNEASSTSSEGDKVSGKEESGAVVNGDTKTITHSGKNTERVSGFGESIEEIPVSAEKVAGFGESIEENPLSAEKMEGFGESTNTENPIEPNVPNTLGENLLEDAVATLEGGARRLTQDALGKLLLGNVYGLNAASNIQDAISAGSLNGLRNLATKTIDALTGDNSKGSSVGPSIGDNVFPTSTPEIPLSPSNIIKPSSPEKDSNLGNING